MRLRCKRITMSSPLGRTLYEILLCTNYRISSSALFACESNKSRLNGHGVMEVKL